jgi:hypothetical protein
MKIGIVCSHGGHLTETLQILEAFREHDCFFATYHSPRDADVLRIARAYFTGNIGYSAWRLARLSWAWRILRASAPRRS